MARRKGSTPSQPRKILNMLDEVTGVGIFAQWWLPDTAGLKLQQEEQEVDCWSPWGNMQVGVGIGLPATR